MCPPLPSWRPQTPVFLGPTGWTLLCSQRGLSLAPRGWVAQAAALHPPLGCPHPASPWRGEGGESSPRLALGPGDGAEFGALLPCRWREKEGLRGDVSQYLSQGRTSRTDAPEEGCPHPSHSRESFRSGILRSSPPGPVTRPLKWWPQAGPAPCCDPRPQSRGTGPP